MISMPSGGRGFDLDHIGAHLCKQASAGRAGQYTGQIEDPYPAQRAGKTTTAVPVAVVSSS